LLKKRPVTYCLTQRLLNSRSAIESIYHALKTYPVEGKRGFVVGSESPWIEVYALLHGADEVYSFILPFPRTNQNRFDFAMSFSSIEHSGLGRYGDATDPIGDLREVWKVLCLLKPGGTFYLGLPRGADSVVYNVHRIYGAIRLAMLMTGTQLQSVGCYSHALRVLPTLSSTIWRHETQQTLFLDN
uniref:DUF268 domain-containing protein n=1 Tax=Angiostrongylus cantonensis TaxID=6313 RepID=A0A0K0DPY2_ANGCA